MEGAETGAENWGEEEGGEEKSGGIMARCTFGIPDSPISVPGATGSEGTGG